MRELSKYGNHYILSNTEILKRVNGNYEIVTTDGKNITAKHECGEVFTTTRKLFLKAKEPCPLCSNRNHQLNTEIFKRRVQDLVDDEYSVLGEYIKSSEKIKMMHNKCKNTYFVTPNKFMLGRRCPYCAKNRKLTLQCIKDSVSNADPEYEVLSTEYINSIFKLTFLHLKCNHTFMMRETDFLKDNGNRCPYCKSSRSEKFIENYLKNKNINFNTQQKFDGLGSKRFDFAIYNESMTNILYLLEYDGEMHYSTIFGDNSYKLQNNSDITKEDFCIKNNIPLYRIPYWYKDRLESVLDIITSNKAHNKVQRISKTLNEEVDFNCSSTTIENVSHCDKN